MAKLTKKTVLRGPGGIRLILDPKEYYPDDPGQGTPAMIELKGQYSTYTCATCEGNVDGEPLTDKQSEWLYSEKVDAAVESIYED